MIMGNLFQEAPLALLFGANYLLPALPFSLPSILPSLLLLFDIISTYFQCPLIFPSITPAEFFWIDSKSTSSPVYKHTLFT